MRRDSVTGAVGGGPLKKRSTNEATHGWSRGWPIGKTRCAYNGIFSEHDAVAALVLKCLTHAPWRATLMGERRRSNGFAPVFVGIGRPNLIVLLELQHPVASRIGVIPNWAPLICPSHLFWTLTRNAENT